MAKEIQKHKIWQMPWGFPEGIAVVCGIVIVGFALQFNIGGFNFYLLAYPVNILVGLFIIGLSALLSGKGNFVRWFSGVPFAVSLIMALLALTVIMGLTPQSAGDSLHQEGSVFTRLGFDSMTRSWAFVLLYVTILLSLGGLIIRKLRNFNQKSYGFHANHVGLWLVLLAAGLGHADIERYIMHVREGETEWRVYDDEGNVKELPIAIQLNDFDMEEYPPQLTVIDRQSGIPQPEEKPDFYQIDTKNIKGRLSNWNIIMEEYIHQAVRSSDSTYREVPMPGATPAARIVAENISTGEKQTGWVCGGNFAQLYMTLPLNEQYCVVMTQAEPRRFMSDIEVYTKNGKVKRALLEVNKPLRTGHWAVYQYGYDNQAGRLSSYSSMELVYDPWKPLVYIGFALIAFGSLSMIWNGKKSVRKREKSE